VPVTGVRSLLDWASTTVAPPISDIANRTVPKIFLIVEFLRLLFPRQSLNLLDPRVGNATRVLLCYVDGSVPLSEPGWVTQCMVRPCVARGLLRVCGHAICAAVVARYEAPPFSSVPSRRPRSLTVIGKTIAVIIERFNAKP